MLMRCLKGAYHCEAAETPAAQRSPAARGKGGCSIENSGRRGLGQSLPRPRRRSEMADSIQSPRRAGLVALRTAVSCTALMSALLAATPAHGLILCINPSGQL